MSYVGKKEVNTGYKHKPSNNDDKLDYVDKYKKLLP